jgi:hypothetical protein
MKSRRNFYGLVLAAGGAALGYMALRLDFSQVPVEGLWFLAALGVLMVVGIYVLVVKTEGEGDNGKGKP